MDLRIPTLETPDTTGAGAALLDAVVRPSHSSDLGRFSQRLRALNSLSTRLVLMDQKLPAYDEIARGVWRVVGCDVCALYVLDAGARRLELVGQAGHDGMPARRFLSLDDLDTFEVQAIVEEYTVNVADIPPSSAMRTISPLARSVLVFPVQAAEGPIGVFSFAWFASHGFDADDADMCGMVVDQMTYMLENFRLVRQLSESRDAVIRGMAIMAESRCADIRGHLDRIAAYTRLLTARLVGRPVAGGHVDGAWVETIARASLLHDVGKVGIPDVVLLKPGRLDEAEFEIMRTHSTIGAKILDDLMQVYGTFPMLAMGAEVARSHHERWDGEGYPAKLAGVGIPLAARIVAIADVYDALTTKRIYKDAWTHDAAVDYLREQAGRQFDPALVATLLADHRELVEIRRQFPE